MIIKVIRWSPKLSAPCPPRGTPEERGYGTHVTWVTYLPNIQVVCRCPLQIKTKIFWGNAINSNSIPFNVFFWTGTLPSLPTRRFAIRSGENLQCSQVFERKISSTMLSSVLLLLAFVAVTMAFAPMSNRVTRQVRIIAQYLQWQGNVLLRLAFFASFVCYSHSD